MFWTENAHKLNDNRQDLLEMLITMLQKSNDPLVLCVAANDIGEFERSSQDTPTLSSLRITSSSTLDEQDGWLSGYDPTPPSEQFIGITSYSWKWVPRGLPLPWAEDIFKNLHVGSSRGGIRLKSSHPTTNLLPVSKYFQSFIQPARMINQEPPEIPTEKFSLPQNSNFAIPLIRVAKTADEQNPSNDGFWNRMKKTVCGMSFVICRRRPNTINLENEVGIEPVLLVPTVRVVPPDESFGTRWIWRQMFSERRNFEDFLKNLDGYNEPSISRFETNQSTTNLIPVSKYFQSFIQTARMMNQEPPQIPTENFSVLQNSNFAIPLIRIAKTSDEQNPPNDGFWNRMKKTVCGMSFEICRRRPNTINPENEIGIETVLLVPTVRVVPPAPVNDESTAPTEASNPNPDADSTEEYPNNKIPGRAISDRSLRLLEVLKRERKKKPHVRMYRWDRMFGEMFRERHVEDFLKHLDGYNEPSSSLFKREQPVRNIGRQRVSNFIPFFIALIRMMDRDPENPPADSESPREMEPLTSTYNPSSTHSRFPKLPQVFPMSIRMLDDQDVQPGSSNFRREPDGAYEGANQPGRQEQEEPREENQPGEIQPEENQPENRRNRNHVEMAEDPAGMSKWRQKWYQMFPERHIEDFLKHVDVSNEPPTSTYNPSSTRSRFPKLPQLFPMSIRMLDDQDVQPGPSNPRRETDGADEGANQPGTARQEQEEPREENQPGENQEGNRENRRRPYIFVDIPRHHARENLGWCARVEGWCSPNPVLKLETPTAERPDGLQVPDEPEATRIKPNVFSRTWTRIRRFWNRAEVGVVEDPPPAANPEENAPAADADPPAEINPGNHLAVPKPVLKPHVPPIPIGEQPQPNDLGNNPGVQAPELQGRPGTPSSPRHFQLKY
ncbi:unnamed protein product [Caenorhabditis nigoni]